VVLFGQLFKHGLPVLLLSHSEGRCGEVDDGTSALPGQLRHRIGMIATATPEVGIVPDILANGYPQPLRTQLQDLSLSCRLKVAILVEDVVCGKQALLECPLHFSMPQQGGAVEERPAHRAGIGLGQAHQDRWQIPCLCSQAAQAGPATIYKIRV